MKDNIFDPHDIVWTSEKNGRLWNYYSKSQHHQNKYFGRSAGRQVVALMQRKHLLRGTRTILDFSCGTGYIIEHLSRHLTKQQTVIGIDVSSESIKEAIQRNSNCANFAGAYTISTWPSPLPDNSQDLIFATEVIEHLTDEEIADALGECRRLLRPGGRLFLTTPNDEILDAEKTLCPECGCIFHRWQHIQSWTRDRLSACLHNQGFRVDVCDTIVWGPWPVQFYFMMTRRKPTGLYAVATASGE